MTDKKKRLSNTIRSLKVRRRYQTSDTESGNNTESESNPESESNAKSVNTAPR